MIEKNVPMPDSYRQGAPAKHPFKNMEVGASLSAAIIVKGKLWGLIACHHKSAKYLDFYQRESCRFLAQMFSNEIALRETGSFIQKREVCFREVTLI